MASAVSRVVSAALGAFLVQVATWGVQQGSAAWGWRLSVPSDANFTCQEGVSIGCDSMPPDCGQEGGCCTSHYTCTITPNDGYTCDTANITVQCKLDSESEWKQPSTTKPSGEEVATQGQDACINIGNEEYNMTVNAELRWSGTVMCEVGSGDNGGGDNGGGGGDNGGGDNDGDGNGTGGLDFASRKTAPALFGTFLAVAVVATWPRLSA